MVARAGDVFDAEGRIVDAGIERRLRGFVDGFCAHLDRQPGAQDRMLSIG